MPRLVNQPPRLSKSGNYAYVYLNGERLAMGRYGSKEADQNYRRFLAEWASSSRAAMVRPGSRASVEEIVCGYLDWAETNIDYRDYNHSKAALAFVLELYARSPAAEFGPKALAAELISVTPEVFVAIPCVFLPGPK